MTKYTAAKVYLTEFGNIKISNLACYMHNSVTLTPEEALIIFTEGLQLLAKLQNKDVEINLKDNEYFLPSH